MNEFSRISFKLIRGLLGDNTRSFAQISTDSSAKWLGSSPLLLRYRLPHPFSTEKRRIFSWSWPSATAGDARRSPLSATVVFTRVFVLFRAYTRIFAQQYEDLYANAHGFLRNHTRISSRWDAYFFRTKTHDCADIFALIHTFVFSPPRLDRPIHGRKKRSPTECRWETRRPIFSMEAGPRDFSPEDTHVDSLRRGSE